MNSSDQTPEKQRDGEQTDAPEMPLNELPLPPAPNVQITTAARGTEYAGKWRNPAKKNPGSLPILGKDVPGLDSTTLKPVVADPERNVLRAWEALGIRRDWVSKAKIRAVKELGKYQSMQFTASLLMTFSMDSLEQVEFAMTKLKEVLQKDGLTAYDVSCLAGAMANCAKSHQGKVEQIMELAEKATEKEETKKMRNAPPMVPIQINVGQQSPNPTANSGSKP